MERPIGEEFEFEGKTLKVAISPKRQCRECFFWDSPCFLDEVKDVTGECVRDDGMHVIFKEVKNNQSN